eukprot:s554_g4.t1
MGKRGSTGFLQGYSKGSIRAASGSLSLRGRGKPAPVLWENRHPGRNGAYRRGIRGSHHADMQQYLVETGADKDLLSSGCTPLARASAKGFLEMVRIWALEYHPLILFFLREPL